MDTYKPLVVITGPTASGKSDVAMKLAMKYGGEIICADSRTVYKGMDIGTAKPSIRDQKLIPHHLLDVATPGQRFTAADFQKLANKAIKEIRSRGKIPFLVGGTGLYIDSVILDYTFDADYDPKLRQKLEAMSLEELYIYSKTNNIKLPENYKNKRYVVRNIERNGRVVKSNNKNISTSIVVAIATENETLRNRIVQRTEHIFESGVVKEAKLLGEKYGWNNESMTGNIYPIIHKLLSRELTIDEAKEKSITQDWRLAKRQITWLKRNKFIQWMPFDEVYSYISQGLDTRQS
ncbi:MAG: tRNA (adenosine(37)-N6)-dimethylallyltransferase MiaA [Candidatus Saccharibacteria bacterium]|nr:tRNA (adenosine(37)-N6)-dimethylallyltransferase MiaA [Candidatus Saccharibacteria bacterium]